MFIHTLMAFLCGLLLNSDQAKVIPGPNAVNLRTEYSVNPYIDIPRPRLSWELTSENTDERQTAYRVLVASTQELLDQDHGDFWDSGKILSDVSNQVEYDGKALGSSTKAYWKVKCWGRDGKPGIWSKTVTWETALMSPENWKASWIGYDLNKFGKGRLYHLPPAPYLRKVQHLPRNVRKATLYVSALGLYEFYINGVKVGDEYFSPGWTDYNKRVYYQSYDVTNSLKKGTNAFSAMLSYGWYAGYVGYALSTGVPKTRAFYGEVPLLKAQILITYDNGQTEMVTTDGTWKANQGALKETDILNGELYDARLEFKGWKEPGFKDAQWNKVEVYNDRVNRIVQQYPGNPVKVLKTLKPLSYTERPGHKVIADFGQNFAGIVKLSVKGDAGDTIVLRYGEMLHPDGSLMTENLRKARASDTYVLKGDKNGESWSPQFTYHGFQYVEITGLKGKPEGSILTGLVLGSETPRTGTFETDNPILNQIYSNIYWTQQANYFDIPTDCPQRDERLGWTGDAQIYIRSASYNNDISAFYTKWITDLNDAQWANGAYPIYAPMPVTANGLAAIRPTATSSPGWSEAGIICVYEIYRAYADLKIIQKSFPHMQRYMDYLDRKSDRKFLFKEGAFGDLVPKGGFGDWLAIGEMTPPDLIATLYYGYVAGLMGEMAEALGKHALARGYFAQKDSIKKSFNAYYVNNEGKFIADIAAYGDRKGYPDPKMAWNANSQTAYANAIYMQMLDPVQQHQAGKLLASLVRANGNKLATGFLGFKALLPALSISGEKDLAYHLLLSTEYPSLGFEVLNGATTIWERWNSYTTEKGFENNAGMNSFSHYSFGAINEWLFGHMAGIMPLSPGFKTFSIKPEIAMTGINWLKTTYHSIHGEINVSWRKEAGVLNLVVTVPVNTVATIYIPAKQSDQVQLFGDPISNFPEVRLKNRTDHYLQLEAGSGKYSFSVGVNN